MYRCASPTSAGGTPSHSQKKTSTTLSKTVSRGWYMYMHLGLMKEGKVSFLHFREHIRSKASTLCFAVCVASTPLCLEFERSMEKRKTDKKKTPHSPKPHNKQTHPCEAQAAGHACQCKQSGGRCKEHRGRRDRHRSTPKFVLFCVG